MMAEQKSQSRAVQRACFACSLLLSVAARAPTPAKPAASEVRRVPAVPKLPPLPKAPPVPSVRDLPKLGDVPKLDVPKLDVPKLDVPKLDVPTNAHDLTSAGEVALAALPDEIKPLMPDPDKLADWFQGHGGAILGTGSMVLAPLGY